MMDVDTPAPGHDGQQAAAAGQDPQASSCLIRYLKTKFPLELFLRLTEFMENNSVYNTRLVCRELECALLPTFQKRFFSKRHVCLTERSLRRLAAVSDEPRLAGGITTVAIGCIRSLSDSESEDDSLIIDSGYDVELLVHAFSNFPSLQNVTISYSPYVSRANIAPHIADILGRDNPRKLLRKLLHSLSRAGCELRVFEMDHHGGTGGGFCLSDLHISNFLLEPFSRPLRPVKKLTLALDPNRSNVSYLMKFLAMPRELDHLRLNLDREAAQSSTLLDTLAQSPLISLSHLTQLDLGKMTVSTKSLLNFTAVFGKTLTRLSFFRIGLIQAYPPADTSPPDPTGDPPHVPALLWQFVFREMAAMPELENLTKFSADCLTERVVKNHVAFRQTAPGGDPATSAQTKYTGDYARRFLEDLAGDVVVPSPRRVNPPALHGGQGDGDDDSNEDDDDEDDDGDGDDSNDGDGEDD